MAHCHASRVPVPRAEVSSPGANGDSVSVIDRERVCPVTGGRGMLAGPRQNRLPAKVPCIPTCIYYTGIDPFTQKPVKVARGLRDRKLQRALMQSIKPAVKPPCP